MAEFGYLLESRRYLVRWEEGYQGPVTVVLNQCGCGVDKLCFWNATHRALHKSSVDVRY